MGYDQTTTKTHTGGFQGDVVDKKIRSKIQDYSKSAHFEFTAHKKPTKSTHDLQFCPKDNSVNVLSKPHVESNQRTMKGSHFFIGSPSEKLIYRKPEPNPAVNPPVMIGDFSIED